MTLSLAVLDALVATGCTAAQVVAAIRADLDGNLQVMLAGSPIVVEADKDVRIERPLAEPDRPGGHEADSGARPVAMARKGLGLMPGLSDSGRRVGLALLDHFNRLTGRCDPSEARIAGLLGLSTRTVRRALRELEAGGWFAITLHGGHAHCNAYRPDLDRLAAAAEQWDAGMKMNNADKVVRFEGAKRPSVTVQPDIPVRQTQLKNPDSDSGGVERMRGRRSKPPDPRQRSMLLPIGGSVQGLAASEAAKRRVWDDVRGHFLELGPDAYQLALATVPDSAWERAHDAEMRRRGAGLQAVLMALSGFEQRGTG